MRYICLRCRQQVSECNAAVAALCGCLWQSLWGGTPAKCKLEAAIKPSPGFHLWANKGFVEDILLRQKCMAGTWRCRVEWSGGSVWPDVFPRLSPLIHSSHGASAVISKTYSGVHNCVFTAITSRAGRGQVWLGQ